MTATYTDTKNATNVKIQNGGASAFRPVLSFDLAGHSYHVWINDDMTPREILYRRDLDGRGGKVKALDATAKKWAQLLVELLGRFDLAAEKKRCQDEADAEQAKNQKRNEEAHAQQLAETAGPELLAACQEAAFLLAVIDGKLPGTGGKSPEGAEWRSLNEWAAAVRKQVTEAINKAKGKQ